ncbi:MAG: nuclear transport factor 2 family protein [Terracoccus sp.]
MTDDVRTVLDLERQRLRSLVERDIPTADQLHHADYELITPAGHRHTKSSYLDDTESKRLEHLVFEPTTPVAVRSTPDLIVPRYIALIRLSVGIADEVEFRAWHTDHYERREDRWQALWSQATRIVD